MANNKPRRHVKTVTITLRCSNCGAHEELRSTLVETVEAIKRGWGSFGSAIYCPACTETWDERNPGRPLACEADTFFVISNLFHKERRMQSHERMD